MDEDAHIRQVVKELSGGEYTWVKSHKRRMPGWWWHRSNASGVTHVQPASDDSSLNEPVIYSDASGPEWLLTLSHLFWRVYLGAAILVLLGLLIRFVFFSFFKAAFILISFWAYPASWLFVSVLLVRQAYRSYKNKHFKFSAMWLTLILLVTGIYYALARWLPLYGLLVLILIIVFMYLQRRRKRPAIAQTPHEADLSPQSEEGERNVEEPTI